MRTSGWPTNGAQTTASGSWSSRRGGDSANASPELTAANFIATMSSRSSGTGSPTSMPWLRRIEVS
jgi:hypothetical protein